jgi:hypothetical protein
LVDIQKRSVPGFTANWAVVAAWKEDSRYQGWSRAEAQALIGAITDVPDGVMEWIRLNW